MNNYITLDSKRYLTPSIAWRPKRVVPSSPRFFLNGGFSATFSAVTVLQWDGEIEGPVTATSPYGTITDLKASLEKRQLLSFTDHYGSTKNVLVVGDTPERSLSAKWDSASNIIYVKVSLLTA